MAATRTGDVLQEDEGDATLGAQLDEVGALPTRKYEQGGEIKGMKSTTHRSIASRTAIPNLNLKSLTLTADSEKSTPLLATMPTG